jgi:hypothetical protein
VGVARDLESCPLARQPRTSRRSLRDVGDIYFCFSEGFDTADLKDAKTLLDELSE